MAAGGCRHSLDVGGINDETTPTRHCDLSINPALPEVEFGRGICDSAYRPQTWSRMGELFQQETLSDVMLMAEGQSIACHKFLLAAASEYFYKFVVETETDHPNLLEIEDISFNTLKVIVSYLYTGSINITAENVRDVIPACKMLNLTSAYGICEKFAMNTVNPGNCIGVYKMATGNDVQQLAEKALDIMVNNFTEVVSGREFLTMSEKDVADYIQNENLKIPNEDPVFAAVVSWVKHHPQDRESSFFRLIRHVSLSYCSPHYLRQVVSKHPLMENHKCQTSLVAALIQSSSDFQTHHHSFAPRKAYARETTLVTVGGKSDPGNIIRADCWRLEEAGWREMEESPIPATVETFSACAMKERILVTGGYSGEEPLSQCWLLSTSTYQWSRLPDMNTPRARHASVCVEGRPYVIAGEVDEEKLLSSVECLPLFSKNWKTLPPMPKALAHVMVVSYGESIYVFGGLDMKDNPSQSVFVYSTNSRSWQTVAGMPHIVCNLASAVVWRDRIYIVGGSWQSCMCYDPVLAQWSTLSQCRHEHIDGPVLVWKNRIVVCGGRSREAERDNGQPGGTSVIEEYDPETDTWTVSLIELPQKLSSHFVFSVEVGI